MDVQSIYVPPGEGTRGEFSWIVCDILVRIYCNRRIPEWLPVIVVINAGACTPTVGNCGE